jgi:transcriptional regulator GlxA family with amidase domain
MVRQMDFVVYQDALGLDITGPMEVFNTATNLYHSKTGEHAYKCRVCAIDYSPVTFSSGMRILPDIAMEEISNSDSIFIPGGKDLEHYLQDPHYMSTLKQCICNSTRVVSVCLGAYLLAKTGLLNGKSATTHWNVAADFKHKFPEVKLQSNSIFIKTDHIYTSAGVTAGIDLALALVEEDLGQQIAIEVARLLVVYFRRPGTQSQFSSPLNLQSQAGDKFESLYQWLSNHLNQSVSIEQMAEFCHMSQRNFARVFKSQTGMTPYSFLETMRLDQARILLARTTDPLNTIARQSGFKREDTLRKAFLKKFGITPGYYRIHHQEI